MRVLQSFPSATNTTNPYLTQLLGQLDRRADVRTFTWRNALTWDYDVFHVHWPDALVRYSRFESRLGRLLRPLANRAGFVALLVRLKIRHTAVVATRHNLEPHEPLRWFDQILVRRLDQLTTVWIRLNPFTPVPDEDRAVTILHGDYRAWFEACPTEGPPQPGRLLFFGLIRAYKGVDDLISAFTAVQDAPWTLRLVGRPAPESLGATIKAACEKDPRISAELAYADDAALTHEISEAECVVLPYPHMHNSGVAVLALSLNRPVLVPDNTINRALAAEVGDEWVSFFSGRVGPEDLAAAVSRARATLARGTSPDLSSRTWPEAGRRHLQAYRLAMTLRGNGSGTDGPPN